MTMLEIMKERLPKDLTLVKVRELSNRYELLFEVEGKPLKGTLSKTCAPGAAEKVVDFSICLSMLQFHLENGNLEKAAYWKQKQDEALKG